MTLRRIRTFVFCERQISAFPQNTDVFCSAGSVLAALLVGSVVKGKKTPDFCRSSLSLNKKNLDKMEILIWRFLQSKMRPWFGIWFVLGS